MLLFLQEDDGAEESSEEEVLSGLEDCWQCVYIGFEQSDLLDQCIEQLCGDVDEDILDAVEKFLKWEIGENEKEELIECFFRDGFLSDSEQSACFTAYAPEGSEDLWALFVGKDGRDYGLAKYY